MTADGADRLWMGLAGILIAVFVILGISNVLDLDDAQQRSPLPTVSPTTAYNHPEAP